MARPFPYVPIMTCIMLLAATWLLPVEAGASPPPKDEEASPIGGAIVLEQGLGLGTFSGGQSDLGRPYYNVLLSLRPTYQVPIKMKLKVGLRLDMDVNVVENYDSSNTSPHQVQLGDLRLWAGLPGFVKHKASGLSLSAKVDVFFPTSLVSQYATKLFGLRPGVSATWAHLSWMELTYGLSLTKNFNQYTSPTLNWADFDGPRLSRPGGAENVDAFLTATGAGVVEWAVSNSLSVQFNLPEDFSITVEFALINAFTYPTAPTDSYTSAHATGGRGQRDMTYGTIDLSWEGVDHLALSVGTVLSQAPKTDDNSGFRFPFWDTTNGASNRQVFYLSAKASL